jgi:hypothetical protein
MSNTTPSTSEIAANMDQIASDYEHNPIQHVILNPFKNSILVLRAKYATYELITTTLNEQGVKVSEATVRKFCRTHLQEVKRLRAETDRKRREVAGSGHVRSEAPETSSSEPGNRPASTMESSKPGPKIARERL